MVLSLRMAESEGTVSPDELVEQIKNLRRSAWACARPPVTEKEAQEKYVHDRLRQLTVDLIQRGVTVAMLEGTFMVWWLRVVCVQRFDEGGFEFCIAHIGRVMHPIPQILERVYDEIEDAGPMPEMKELGDKVDSLKSHAGAWLSWPKSRDIAGAEQDVGLRAYPAVAWRVPRPRHPARRVGERVVLFLVSLYGSPPEPARVVLSETGTELGCGDGAGESVPD